MVCFRGIGSAENYQDSLARAPIVCESERGPALKQEQVFESIEVRVSLLVNVNDQEFESDKEGISLLVDDELYSARPRAIIPQTRVQALPTCQL